MMQKEILERLHSINGCVVKLTATFDMGLQIDIMTNQGVLSNIGNYVQWPCFCFVMSDEVRRCHDLLVSKNYVSNEDMMKLQFCKILTVFNDIPNGSCLMEQEKVRQILNLLRKELEKMSCTGDSFYAYASPEDWNMVFKLFATYDGLQNFFLETMGPPDRLYDEMTVDELSRCYNFGEENDWEGLPLQSFGL